MGYTGYMARALTKGRNICLRLPLTIDAKVRNAALAAGMSPGLWLQQQIGRIVEVEPGRRRPIPGGIRDTPEAPIRDTVNRSSQDRREREEAARTVARALDVDASIVGPAAIRGDEDSITDTYPASPPTCPHANTRSTATGGRFCADCQRLVR